VAQEADLAEVIHLETMRRHLAARRGLQHWSRRFGEAFAENTRLQDLSDAALGQLVQAGEPTTQALNELIMGIRNMGPAGRFHLMDNAQKMALMDIAIFLIDQIRFECMRRLGWIESYTTIDIPLVDLISDFTDWRGPGPAYTPALAPDHPRYQEYLQEFDADKLAFVRRLIPEAIETFRRRFLEQ
jgi:hypothetical protein